MFARIRSVPYTGGNGQWVAAGFSNQFGQEVQVVAFICKRNLPSVFSSYFIDDSEDGLLAFAYVMLIMVVPYQTSPQRQRIQIYLWTAVIMIMYSVLVSLFRIKNGGTFILLVYCVCIIDKSARIPIQTSFVIAWQSCV